MSERHISVSQACPCNDLVPLALVIDDSSFILSFMKNLLLEVGCQVICAANGLEGVKMFEKHHPQLVFVDALMPEMDGFSACSIIRNTDKGKKALIYMITTSSEPESVDKAFAVGCDDYFTKPINKEIFVPRLKQIMRKYNYGRINNVVREDLEMELKDARAHQTSLLPKPFKNKYVEVDKIYSPFAEVSGDFIDYWWEEDQKKLSGYLLDVTGHSISSAMQVYSLRLLYCQARQANRSLAQILEYMNNELFSTNKRTTISTAFVFELDPVNRRLFYSSAGISPFYTKTYGSQERKPITTPGYSLGVRKGSPFIVEQHSLGEIEEIIFATDGFSELIGYWEDITSKHDDASAIIIKLLQGRK